jgi:hypothetical protein
MLEFLFTKQIFLDTFLIVFDSKNLQNRAKMACNALLRAPKRGKGSNFQKIEMLDPYYSLSYAK